MNIHKLTEQEINNLHKYKELIDSNDKESIMLGASLFYEEYKDKLCPTENLDYYDCSIEFDFSKYKCPIVRCNKVYLKKLKFPNNIGYWRQKITDLLYYNYYCY